jgi:hypothetical protein
MTNFVSFDFHQLNELHPSNTLRTLLTQFPDDIVTWIISFLVPKVKDKEIKIMYESYDSHITFIMPYYDFCFQFVRVLWFKYSLGRHTRNILPTTKQDSQLFKMAHIRYPYVNTKNIEKDELLWSLLLVEVLADFMGDKVYYCVPWQGSSYLNTKYLNVFRNMCE